ncbi:general stress protein [Cohnella sp. GCM10020058]|uniref:general stress protein n=1 Tax=Cohnella sp. GCM10020058 TaxID=3317330 RepID=UPI0036304BCF
MSMTVYGVFDTSKEVIDAIQSLKIRGHSDHDLTVVADREESWSLGNLGQAADLVEVEGAGAGNGSLLGKVKRIIKAGGDSELSGRLEEIGLTNGEAMEYAPEVDKGRFLLLIGHDNGLTDDVVASSPAEDNVSDSAIRNQAIDRELPRILSKDGPLPPSERI